MPIVGEKRTRVELGSSESDIQLILLKVSTLQREINQLKKDINEIKETLNKIVKMLIVK